MRDKPKPCSRPCLIEHVNSPKDGARRRIAPGLSDLEAGGERRGCVVHRFRSAGFVDLDAFTAAARNAALTMHERRDHSGAVLSLVRAGRGPGSEGGRRSRVPKLRRPLCQGTHWDEDPHRGARPCTGGVDVHGTNASPTDDCQESNRERPGMAGCRAWRAPGTVAHFRNRQWSHRPR